MQLPDRVRVTDAAGAISVIDDPQVTGGSLVGNWSITGRACSTGADGLLQCEEDISPRAVVPLESIELLEMSVERGSRAWHGAAIGLGLAMALSAFAASEPEGDFDSGDVFIFGTVILGLPAALIGGIVGGIIETEVWQPIPVPGSAR